MDRSVVRRAVTCLVAAILSGGACGTGAAYAAPPPPVFTRAAAASSPTGTILFDVTCVTARWCLAVGSSGNGLFLNPQEPLIEQWNGTAWSLVSTPKLDQHGALYGVACTGIADCFAVGDFTNAGGAFIEHWDGSRWSIVPNPEAPARTGLSAVTCTDSSMCVAVGAVSLDDHGREAALIETWNGSAWSVATLHSSSQRRGLSDVACATSNDCIAVGGVGGGRTSSTLAFHWDGTTWSRTPTPDVGANDGLSSVACSAVEYCTAVGTTFSPADEVQTIRTVIEHWNGHAWSLDARPAPNQRSWISDVACPGPRRCIAVGLKWAADDDIHTLIYASNGRQWTTAAGPKTDAAGLNGVSCTKQNRCVAVGNTYSTPKVHGFGAFIATSRPSD